MNDRKRLIHRALAAACGAGLALAGCGGADASRDVASGKPDEEVGGEGLVFPSSQALVTWRGSAPDPDALELRVYNASPVGVIGAESLDAYRIYLEAENVSDAPVALEPAWVRAVVTRGATALPGCAGDAIPVRDGGAVGTSGALFVSVPLPCALDEGVYEIAVSFSVGAPPGDERAAVERTLRTELTVDAELPPYDAGWIPPE